MRACVACSVSRRRAERDCACPAPAHHVRLSAARGADAGPEQEALLLQPFVTSHRWYLRVGRSLKLRLPVGAAARRSGDLRLPGPPPLPRARARRVAPPIDASVALSAPIPSCARLELAGWAPHRFPAILERLPARPQPTSSCCGHDVALCCASATATARPQGSHCRRRSAPVRCVLGAPHAAGGGLAGACWVRLHRECDSQEVVEVTSGQAC